MVAVGVLARGVVLIGMVARGARSCVPLGGFELQVEPRAGEAAEAARLRGGGGDGGSNGVARGLSATEAALHEAVETATCRANLRHYASLEHMAGTAGDKSMAEFTRAKMHEFGLAHSEIHEQEAFLNYPVSRSLGLVRADGSVAFQAPMIESELVSDPTSGTQWRNLSFLAYGPSGEARAKLVYANYGRPEDFDVLSAAGVSVHGMVVIVRYGECFRGLKVMNAQERGAIGVIIYSDPLDDGDVVGTVYPDGAWRPADSIQRGSAQFNSLCAGDPGRPGVEAECGYRTEQLIPAVPALPISYGDALPLLRSLQASGRPAPASWVGGLATRLGPGGYHFGPSQLDVKMAVNNTFVRTPIWNVITTIPGKDSSAGSGTWFLRCTRRCVGRWSRCAGARRRRASARAGRRACRPSFY